MEQFERGVTFPRPEAPAQFSNDSAVMLNGMRVIFDQVAALYPVELEAAPGPMKREGREGVRYDRR